LRVAHDLKHLSKKSSPLPEENGASLKVLSLHSSFSTESVFRLVVFPFLGIIRTVLAISISITLALAPVPSSFATPQVTGMVGKMGADAAIGMEDLDCHKAMDGANSDCKCCDTKSMCPDPATCMTKCGKLLDAAKLLAKVALSNFAGYLRIAPEKPPNWGRTPPSPPPRS
jgi:hypothetical protein